MKIKTRNFKCLPDATITIPDSGLILLSGASGSGKSTVLKAILYALFGAKAVKKPYSFGTSTCSVTLEFMGMTVTRTNRPGRLIVNNNSSLEDASAQAFINDRLGLDYEKFIISSYIPQKTNTSILSLPPLEQLRLIQFLAFDDENEKYKAHLKTMVKERSERVTVLRTEEQFAECEKQSIEDDLDPIEFPLTLREGETTADCVKAYRSRMKNFNIVMANLLDKKDSINTDLQKFIYGKADLDMAETELKKLSAEMAKLEAKQLLLKAELDEVPENVLETCEQLQAEIKHLQIFTEREKIKEQFDKIFQDEEHERDTRETQIRHTLWKYRGKQKTRESAEEELADYNSQLELWAEYQRMEQKFIRLQQDLNVKFGSLYEMSKHFKAKIADLNSEKIQLHENKELLLRQAEKLAMEKELIVCPECTAALKFQDGQLISFCDYEPVEDRDYDTEISELEEKISQLEQEKNSQQEILQRLASIDFPILPEKNDPQVFEHMSKQAQTLTLFIEQNTQREVELTRIEKERKHALNTPALKALNQQINEKDLILEELNISPSGKTEDELRQKLQELSGLAEKNDIEKVEFTNNAEQLNVGKIEMKKLSKKVSTLKQKIVGINPDVLKKKLTTVEQDIAKSKKKQAEDEALIDKVEMFLEYQEQKGKLEKWIEKVQVASKNRKIAEAEHTAALILKEKFREAEIKTLNSTIYTINEHTKYYLETFFPEHQLDARLEATFTGKNVKTLKVGSTITYKGNEYDSINSLSGGEFDRCTLASVCGINAMLCSPILILDESLSALDSETNTEIISFLHDLAQDKLVLVCSHEAVTGIFDEIIRMQ